MAKNFSKYLGKIALMVAAVLWSGCSDSEDKKVYPIELKKRDLPKIFQDSIRIKPKLENLQVVALYGVLPDVVYKGCIVKPLSWKQIEVNDGDIDIKTILKVFRQRVHGLRFICNKNMKKRTDGTKEFEGKIILKLKIAPSGKVENIDVKSSTVPFSEEIVESVSHWMYPESKKGGFFTFPISFYQALPSSSSAVWSEKPVNIDSSNLSVVEMANSNSMSGFINTEFFPVDHRYLADKGRLQKVNMSDIIVVNDSVSVVYHVIRRRSPGLHHIYNKYLKKKPDFSGTVVLKIKITLDGFVESAGIDSSTTGYDEFDEEVRKAVSRWNFGKKQIQGTFKIPFTFYEKEN